MRPFYAPHATALLGCYAAATGAYGQRVVARGLEIAVATDALAGTSRGGEQQGALIGTVALKRC